MAPPTVDASDRRGRSRVDLSRLISKYIGETENPSAVFGREGFEPTLIFDEADALLGKRSEVRTRTTAILNLPWRAAA